MDYDTISQFNPANDVMFLRGATGQHELSPVASSSELMDALRDRGADLAVLPEALTGLRDILDIPENIRVGYTFLTITQLSGNPDGAEYLQENPEAIGFCFSYGYEDKASAMLEVFVGIDAGRIAVMTEDDDQSDEQVAATLDLNHWVITQIVLALLEDDALADGTDEDAEMSDEAVAAAEGRAETINERLVEQFGPLFAVIPHDTGDTED